MKKNLKKVISSVIALALSVGSVAMAAPSFSDVPDTASYAQAVNTLAGLGVISGYEDGTFLPDNNITRAEVATMVVAALNRSADAEGSMGTTNFADVNVPEKEWASGYVNIGVSEGFISGYDDGTFKPDNNVTYAEMCSMLVRIAGYGEYATYLGGWPNGYLSVASDRGISKNVSASADTAVTRAQVAQMIYNTLMDVPLTKAMSITVDVNGNYVPVLETMDGREDRDYQTLLTERHNAYYVEGYVSNTNRTSPSGVDPDEVEFTIEYTKNYNDMEYTVEKGNENQVREEIVYVGDTDAANNLFTYASAIIQIDDNDDATLVSFVPSGRNSVAEYNTNLIDEYDYDPFGSDPYLRYYAEKSASRSTKYSLADPKYVRLFVNGVEVDWTEDNFNKFVLNNDVGTVQLIDTYSASSRADGDYDVIFATYYMTAQIGAVNASSGRVTFDSYIGFDRVSSITLDPEDDDLVYDIYYNGEEIELSALQTDDVISIAYDVDAGLDASEFYEIYVSRDTATGKYTGQDPEEQTVAIGGTNYEFVEGYESGISKLVMADEYTLYLDAFGRIFTTDLAASSAKLAVLDRYTKSSADDYCRATIYTTDGTARSLEVDTSRVSVVDTEGLVGEENATLTGSDVDTYFKKIVYEDGESGAKNPIQNRVVEYKISSSSGRIIDLVVSSSQRQAIEEDFRTSSNALGSIKLNDATTVIDAIDYAGKDAQGEIPSYSDLSLSSVAGFVEDGSYTAYAYGTRANDGTYPLVIVISAGGNYVADTNFAIVAAAPGTGVDSETGDEIYTLAVYYQGQDLTAEDDKLIVNEDVVLVGVDEVNQLQKGDVIVFVNDGQGNIKQIDVLATADELGVATGNTYDDAFAKGTAISKEFAVPGDANNWTGSWFDYDDVDQSKDVTRIVYGPVVDKVGNGFVLGNIANTPEEGIAVDDGSEEGTTYNGLYTDMAAREELGGIFEIDMDSDTNVYIYNYAESNSKNRLSLGTTSDVMGPIYSDSLLYNNGDFIPWENITDEDGTCFVFAKVVEDYATDVFVIMPN